MRRDQDVILIVWIFWIAAFIIAGWGKPHPQLWKGPAQLDFERTYGTDYSFR